MRAAFVEIGGAALDRAASRARRSTAPRRWAWRTSRPSSTPWRSSTPASRRAPCWTSCSPSSGATGACATSPTGRARSTSTSSSTATMHHLSPGSPSRIRACTSAPSCWRRWWTSGPTRSFPSGPGRGVPRARRPLGHREARGRRMRQRYIVVEGPIGCGKTSLAHKLAQRLGAALLLEDPERQPVPAPVLHATCGATRCPRSSSSCSSACEQLGALQQPDLFGKPTVADFTLAKDPLFARLTLERRGVPALQPHLRAREAAGADPRPGDLPAGLGGHADRAREAPRPRLRGADLARTTCAGSPRPTRATSTTTTRARC